MGKETGVCNVKFSKLDIFGSSLAFRFVDDFVVDSILGSKRVERMMEIYEAEFFQSKSEYDMPFHKLEYSRHILEDGNVEKYLEDRCVAIDDLYHPGEDKSINQRTKEILNELNQFIQESYKENAKDTIGEIITSGDGWANRLLDYLEKTDRTFIGAAVF